MTLATSAKDVKFYKWSDISFLGVYESPIDCMIVKSISWCCEGRKLLVTKSKGNPVIIKVPNKPEQFIEPYDSLNLNHPTVATYANTNPNMAAFGFEDGDIIVYNLKNKQRILRDGKKLPSSIQHLEFSSEDENIAAGCVNGQIFLLDSRWKPCASFVIPNSPSLSTLSFSETSPNLLAGASKDGILCLWDTESVDNLLCTKTHSGRITDISFYGNIFSSIGTDGKFVSYDLRCLKLNNCFELDCPLSSLAYLPGTYEIALSTTTGQLRSYDLRNMSSPLRTLVANINGGIKQIAFPNTEEDNATIFSNLYVTKNFTKNYEDDFSASGDFSIVTDSTQKFSNPCENKEPATAENEEDSPPLESLESSKIMKTNELDEFGKLLEEKMKMVSKDFEDKLLQSFYGLRINTSKQFIGLEGKISQSWNNFVDYLKLSGGGSICTEKMSKEDLGCEDIDYHDDNK